MCDYDTFKAYQLKFDNFVKQTQNHKQGIILFISYYFGKDIDNTTCIIDEAYKHNDHKVIIRDNGKYLILTRNNGHLWIDFTSIK